MSKQLIITVSREFGSGGHVIAEYLAEKFELPLYDHNLLREITDEKNIPLEHIKRYDELPKNPWFSRTIRGYSNSPEENIANMQFEYLKKKADNGDSFVVVGRCAESILKNYDGLISFFVLADMEAKVKRIEKINGISQSQAEALIKRNDKERKAYHNYYCTVKWGDSRNYDISINSSKLGISRTAEMLEQYIKVRIGSVK